MSKLTDPIPSDLKPKLAITMGDPAGIGAEIIVRTFAQGNWSDRCRSVIVGSISCLEAASRQTGIEIEFQLLPFTEHLDISHLDYGQSDPVQVIEPWQIAANDFKLGELNAACGKAAFLFFEYAVKEALKGSIDGIVTCPVNKEAVHLAGYEGGLGHQEILARMTGSELTATMLMTEGLRVAHLSTHKSLADAVRYVKKDIIVEKLDLIVRSLKSWGMENPRIAVAALNPHAGEGGLLGREEIDEIEPAVKLAREKGIDASGPIPADSVFYRAINGEFDLVLALFHDQGHIAIKVHNFKDSITATMGIPFVRTSVDHGTAFDIAGKNMADASGLSRAMESAIKMVKGNLGTV